MSDIVILDEEQVIDKESNLSTGIKHWSDTGKNQGFMERINNLSLKFQNIKEGSINAHHLFVIEVEDRKGLYDFLKAHNIFAQIHYIPVHTLPYYKEIGYASANLSNSENYYSKCISLPMYPTLTDDEQFFVIEKILSYIHV